MMMQNKLVPKRRFEGFNEEWNKKTISEISDSFSGGTPSAGNKMFYGGNIPFIRSGEVNSENTQLYITNEGLESSSAKLVEKGDILYALYGATSGEVGISKINGAINQAVLAIKPKYGDNSYFITQWLRKQKKTIIETYLQGGQGNLSGSIVKQLIIDLPNDKKEQQKIGQFFKHLDEMIALQQRKLDKKKALKSAYLVEMFPAKGKTVPKRRFEGFVDEWEERELGEVAKSFEYGLNASAIKFDGENKYIRITDIDENTRLFNQNELTSPKTDLSTADNYLLHTGDILFARTGASVGKTYRYQNFDEKVYYAGFLIRARIKKEFDSEFIFQNTLTQKYNSYIKVTSQRSGQPGVNAQEYASYKLLLPSITEQQKIGQFFKHLDEMIATDQQKLEKLKATKQAYLHEMFV